MPDKRRLVFVVTEDWYFWSHRLSLAQAAIAAGYDVFLVAREGEHGERIRAAGIELVPWSVQRGKVGLVAELQSLNELRRLLRSLRPDVVHNVALKPVVFGSFAARLAGPSKVVNALAGLGFVFSSGSTKARLLRTPVRWLLRLVLDRLGHKVIVQNPDDGQWVRQMGVGPARIELIRGAGVDIEHFAPAEPPAEGPVVVSMVSRMLRDKGVPVLVEAARRLAASGPKLAVRLVGAPDPGNLGSMTTEELEAFNTEGVVEWVGAREDIEEVWAQSHIAALPSSYAEGLPKSLLEAAACGRPVVATDTPGCREIARDGETGLLVPADDPVRLAEALRTLAEDKALRDKLGRRAREVVETEFADTVINAQVLDIYSELLA